MGGGVFIDAVSLPQAPIARPVEARFHFSASSVAWFISFFLSASLLPFTGRDRRP
jgi:hypothetical protein